MGSNNGLLDGIVGASFVMILFIYPAAILGIGLAGIVGYLILKYGFSILGKILALFLAGTSIILQSIFQAINFVDKKIIKIV